MAKLRVNGSMDVRKRTLGKEAISRRARRASGRVGLGRRVAHNLADSVS